MGLFGPSAAEVDMFTTIQELKLENTRLRYGRPPQAAQAQQQQKVDAQPESAWNRGYQKGYDDACGKIRDALNASEDVDRETLAKIVDRR